MKINLNENQTKKKRSFFPSIWKFMFVILFFAATSSFGQLLNENFEGGFPAGWATTNNFGYPWNVVNTASAYGIGSNSMDFDFYNFAGPGSEQLNTVLFSAAGTGYYLQFDEAYWSIPGYSDTLQINYSMDGGVTFNQLVVLNGDLTGPLNTAGSDPGYAFSVPAAGQWQTLWFPIPVSTNMIQFNGITAFGNDLYLDNVEVLIPQQCTGSPIPGIASSSDVFIDRK